MSASGARQPDLATRAASGAGDLDPAIVERAARWMARLWSGEVSAADQAACERWRLAHPDHERAWQCLRQFEDKLVSVPAPLARHALLVPAQAAARQRRRLLGVVGLGLAAGATGWAVSTTERAQRTFSDIQTGTGEIRELALADGSRIVLSSETGIDLRFSDQERLIVLHSGQLLVTTAADPAPMHRPLRVRSPMGVVEALGTRFSVRRDASTVEVAVFSGAVEIAPAARPLARARVDAGGGARFDELGLVSTGPVAASAEAWTRGLLVASAMRLDDLVLELRRFRRGHLACDPAVAGLRVSGVFPLLDTDRALHNLTLALPVTLRHRSRYWVTIEPG